MLTSSALVSSRPGSAVPGYPDLQHPAGGHPQRQGQHHGGEPGGARVLHAQVSGRRLHALSLQRNLPEWGHLRHQVHVVVIMALNIPL